MTDQGQTRRCFQIPPRLEAEIARILNERWQLSLENPTHVKSLAADVLKMSDYYIANPLGKTPWAEAWCQRAQLVYFLPLNATRMRAVLTEAEARGFFTGLNRSVDFGSGLGASHFALSCFTHLGLEETEVELSPEARSLRSDLGPVQFGEETRGKDELLICSFSLTEFRESPELIKSHSDLILVEPGTREDGRKLLELREKLKTMGYSLWAPCTHQGLCPLYTESQTDWCHDRIHFQAPPWFLEMEKHLPIKNPTLTFSYLVASKRQPLLSENLARLTGDRLREKGKTRQLFCRNEKREFLSWLDRYGEAPVWDRGLLISVPDGEIKGNELRVKN